MVAATADQRIRAIASGAGVRIERPDEEYPRYIGTSGPVLSVAIDPAVLQQHVEQAVQTVAGELNCQAEFRQTQSFRPGRPVPTHRFADV